MPERPDTPPDPYAKNIPFDSGDAQPAPEDDELHLDELNLAKDDDSPGHIHDIDIKPPEGAVRTKALEESDHPIAHEPAGAHDESLRAARLITIACYRNLPLFGKRQIKDALIQDIRIVTRQKPFRILAWCVMPEHVHFFMYPRVDDPSPLEIIRTIQHRFAVRLIRRWRDINAKVLDEITDPLGSVHIWEPDTQEDLIISRHDEIGKVITLIETKPVLRGLVDAPEHWNWSSAKWRLGEESHGLPLEFV